MKIFVTGATGFIGSHVVRHLKNQGNEVWALIRPTTQTVILEENHIPFWVDSGTIRDLIVHAQAQKYDGIIHLASCFVNRHQPEQVEQMITDNVLLATRLLEMATQTEIKWMINTGTFWQHYKNEPYSPVNLYAATKQATEDIARYYWESSDLRFITLMLSDTYGPGDTRPKVMNLWNTISQTNEPLAMSGGEQLMDLVYVQDVASAYELAIKGLASDPPHFTKGQQYAVGSGHYITLRQLAQEFERATGRTLRIQWGAKPYLAREVMCPWDQGQLLPGWVATMSLREGLKKTFCR